MKSNLIRSGRTAERRVPAALLASLAFPGLGQMYCGRLSRGAVFAAALFLAALLAPLGLVLHPDEPSLHRAVFLAALYAVTLLLCHADALFSAWNMKEFSRKSYTDGWAYALFALFSLALQLGALVAVTSFYSTDLIDTDAMEPTFLQGERVLLARPPNRPWKAGDAVAFSGGGAVMHGRIIAVTGDLVGRAKGRLEVNGVPLSLGIYQDRELVRRGITNPENVYYEVCGERKYSVVESLGRGPAREGDFAATAVEKNSVLIVFDNRPARAGPVPADTSSIRGRLEGVLLPGYWRRLLLLSHYPL